ncbi:Thioredoxin [Candidatus Hodgkinia cicadicola]|nr:Thioredoxin [Candidatus Hodgkinia cicadicola]
MGFVRERTLKLRSLKLALESKVSSLALVWSSWCRGCVGSISLVLSELKLKLLSFDAKCRGLIKLGFKHSPIVAVSSRWL